MRMPAPALATLFLLSAFFFVLLVPALAEAEFNPSYIISDNDFSAAGTMSEQQIQGFLEAKGSFLANYYEERSDTRIGPGDNINPYGWRASRIIWQTANWYGINPQVILATLQKEQSLITDPYYPPPEYHWRIDYAMGYGCPDSGGCSYAGFARQVDMGTWQLSYNMYYANQRDGRVAPYLTGNTINIDGSNVYLGNGATASLYRYTPHFHGNQNFYNIYTRWFVFSPPPPDNTGSSTVGVDPDGDTFGELAVFYDYGWGRTGLILFEPNGSGYAPGPPVWFSSAWELSRSKIVPVDPNGDGKTELAVLYDSGWSNTALYIFDPNGAGGYNAPRKLWESGAGNWDWSRSKITAVDPDGDGHTELAVFYDYGNANTGLFVFDPSGSGYGAPHRVWLSGFGGWEWSRSKIAGADQKFVVFYNYGNSNTGLWVFEPSGSEFVSHPVWISGPGGWDWSRSKISVVDQNRDGQVELAVFYNYGNANTGLWLFDPNGAGGYNPPRPAWFSGPGGWEWSRSKKTTTDQTGDSMTELADFYDYGNANTGLWLFDPNGSSYAPRRVWLSGAGNWEWLRSKPVL